MKNLLLILGLVLSSPVYSAKIKSGWYTLPENQNQELIKSLHQEGQLETVDQEIKDLSSLTQEISKIENAGTKWALRDMKTVLALGASGSLGVLSWGGTKALELEWKKRTSQKESSPLPKVSHSLEIEQENREVWIQKVETYFQSSGLKTDSALKKVAGEFFDLAQAGQLIQNKTKWSPAKLRLDISASTSANVLPILTKFGADVRVRFEWTPRKKSSATTPRESVLANSLLSLITTVTEEIPAQEKKWNKKVNSFRLDQIQIGLALTGKGSVGVAKVSTTISPSIYLKRSTQKIVKRNNSGSDKLAIASDSLTKEEATYLSLTNGKVISRSGKKTILVKKRRVRRGIKKAFRFARKFVKRIEKNEKKRIDRQSKWYVKVIKSQYSFSVGGDIGVVTLQAKSALALEFRRPKK